ncbi:hypothetical protein FJZ40_01875 [Candidatus Shapirobacteria bacterium]|nr:hypothetical protein [Candidatus Shapirobacteria bacterium]
MDEDILRGREKVIVWIAGLANPLIAGFLFYYSWRKKFPNKAKQANTISFLALGIDLTLYLLLQNWFKLSNTF